MTDTILLMRKSCLLHSISKPSLLHKIAEKYFDVKQRKNMANLYCLSLAVTADGFIGLPFRACASSQKFPELKAMHGPGRRSWEPNEYESSPQERHRFLSADYLCRFFNAAIA
jgi:hypothetical protein